ncbi:MAG: hypothetical protein WA941_13535 [Nitrososphaeraceae archaeon]
MIGLSIVLGLIGILYFATTLDVIKASEESQEGQDSEYLDYLIEDNKSHK